MVRVDFENRERLAELMDREFYKCYQCGTCTVNCLLGDSLLVRRTIRHIQLGITPGNGYIWKCISCNFCGAQCPSNVDIAHIFRSLKALKYEEKNYPEKVNEVLWNVYEEGNPLGSPKKERFTWLQKTGSSDEYDVLIYTCCMAAYDKHGQDILMRTAYILEKAGLKVGFFTDSSCCGDAVYHVGDDYFYEEVANQNAERLDGYKAEVILTVSPHVYHNLKNLYPRYNARISTPILHHTQYLYELLNEGRLKLGKLEARVTYHDPCYLARYNDIVEEPRGLLEAIDGIEFVEMPHSKRETLCCGGGGGGIWLENEEARDVTRRRLDEVAYIDTNVMATACPYCIRMFEDESKVLNMDLNVIDVTELLYEALVQSVKAST